MKPYAGYLVVGAAILSVLLTLWCARIAPTCSDVQSIHIGTVMKVAGC
jgi:hypothetical protein